MPFPHTSKTLSLVCLDDFFAYVMWFGRIATDFSQNRVPRPTELVGKVGGPYVSSKYSPSPNSCQYKKEPEWRMYYYNLAHSNFWTFHLLCSAGNIFWFSKSRRHFWSSILLQNFITIYVRMICIYLKKNILFTGSIT